MIDVSATREEVWQINDGFEEISRGELVEADPEQQLEVPMVDKWQ